MIAHTMALLAYAVLKGTKSGQITGSVSDNKGPKGSIGVLAVSHTVTSPRDPQSGLPTGKRMHGPFCFTKELDRSTPALLNMLTTNETLSATFSFFLPDGTKPAYTVELVNASISSYDVEQANTADAATKDRTIQENLKLVYQKITWTWTDGGRVATDDWESAQ
jgi:type VI secretion system secreted protein Hcp